MVASIGQLLDLKLRRQLASMVQARSRGLVETIEAAPSSQTERRLTTFIIEYMP